MNKNKLYLLIIIILTIVIISILSSYQIFFFTTEKPVNSNKEVEVDETEEVVWEKDYQNNKVEIKVIDEEYFSLQFNNKELWNDKEEGYGSIYSVKEIYCEESLDLSCLFETKSDIHDFYYFKISETGELFDTHNYTTIYYKHYPYETWEGFDSIVNNKLYIVNIVSYYESNTAHNGISVTIFDYKNDIETNFDIDVDSSLRIQSCSNIALNSYDENTYLDNVPDFEVDNDTINLTCIFYDTHLNESLYDVYIDIPTESYSVDKRKG